MKQYYKLFNIATQRIEYWHGSPARSNYLLRLGVLILPLGSKKPKNVSRETIREF